MDFGLTLEQEMLAQSVCSFARRELADGALDRAHDPRYPWEVARALAKQSLLGLTINSSDGGGGATLTDAVIAIQEIAMICPASADVIQAGNFGAIRTFSEYASAEQKQRYLPDLLAGRALMALAMSEPDAGSAITQLRTTARLERDGYVLNGIKCWSTNSADATLFLVYVRFGPGSGGIGSVIVERGAAGLTIGPPQAFMSGEVWCELRFDDCLVSADNLLLGPGGFRGQMAGLNIERIGNAARALALGRHAYVLARDHAKTRTQFGRTLSEFQGVQWKFAEMAVQLDAAQLLLYRAAASADSGLPSPYESAVAKYAANLAGFQVANEALQVMGAMGYSTQTLVEYCVRRTRGWMIAGGSVEILKNRIAEQVFDRRFSQWLSS